MVSSSLQYPSRASTPLLVWVVPVPVSGSRRHLHGQGHLAREGGADKDVLRFCTHGGPADIMEVHTSLGWSKLCAQVAPIEVKRREGTRGTGPAEAGEITGPA